MLFFFQLNCNVSFLVFYKYRKVAEAFLKSSHQGLMILLMELSAPQYRYATCSVGFLSSDWLLTESLSRIQSSSRGPRRRVDS